jgi:hypothetical protein
MLVDLETFLAYSLDIRTLPTLISYVTIDGILQLEDQIVPCLPHEFYSNLKNFDPVFAWAAYWMFCINTLGGNLVKFQVVLAQVCLKTIDFSINKAVPSPAPLIRPCNHTRKLSILYAPYLARSLLLS